jgi:hypothetical protein
MMTEKQLKARMAFDLWKWVIHSTNYAYVMNKKFYTLSIIRLQTYF